MSADDTSPVLDRSLPPFTNGDIIGKKYRIEEVLGCGGMAWVLRARHVQLNQQVALKVLRFEPTSESVARFFQEGRAAARVSSEAVTRVLDVDTLPDGAPYLVMEYLDGYDLEQVVNEPEPLPVTTSVDIAIQACEGLAEVHAAGIVHRDLKPANLFLARKGDGFVRVKLLDFGISKFAAGGARLGRGDAPMTVTSPHALMGSPVYMAPEQMRSTKNVDERADIWSMGVILYELLSGGRSPFAAATLPEVCTRVLRETPESLDTLRSDLPRGLEAVVARCLEKMPSRRYATAAGLAIALAPYASRDGALLARRMQHRRAPVRTTRMRVPRPNGFDVAPVLPPPNPPPRRRGDLPPWQANEPPTRPRSLTATIALFERPSLIHGAPSLHPSPGPGQALSRPPTPFAVQSPSIASISMTPPSDRRAAWTAVVLSALATVIAAASFAVTAKPSPTVDHVDGARAAAIGIASPMPHASSTGAAAARVEPPSSLSRVYTPEELPLVSSAPVLSPALVEPSVRVAAPSVPVAPSPQRAAPKPAPAPRVVPTSGAVAPAPKTPRPAAHPAPPGLIDGF